jgi:hypothetical protein
MPKLSDTFACQQAEQLQMPALIRVIDILSKRIGEAALQGTYEQLQFHHKNQDFTLNVWDLCNQVRFVDYNPSLDQNGDREVQIDLSLFCEDGEVDWQILDLKAQQQINRLFEHLED